MYYRIDKMTVLQKSVALIFVVMSAIGLYFLLYQPDFMEIKSIQIVRITLETVDSEDKTMPGKTIIIVEDSLAINEFKTILLNAPAKEVDRKNIQTGFYILHLFEASGKKAELLILDTKFSGEIVTYGGDDRDAAKIKQFFRKLEKNNE